MNPELMAQLQAVMQTPWEKIPNRDFRTAIEVLKDLVHTNTSLLEKTDQDSLSLFLAKIKAQMAFYLVNDVAVDDLWMELRNQDEGLLHFILRLAVEFRFYIGNELWNTVLENSASAISIHTAAADLNVIQQRRQEVAKTLIDDEFYEKLVTKDKIHQRFKTDVWFYMIFLMSFLPNSTIRPVVTVPGEPEKKDAKKVVQEKAQQASEPGVDNGIGRTL